MSKTITFTHAGTRYVLEFTRKSIETMEKRGFVSDDLIRKPMTALPELFAGAFLAHHPFVSRKIVNAIFDTLGNRRELIGTLSEMYNEPILTLLEGSEDSEGNAEWEKNE